MLGRQNRRVVSFRFITSRFACACFVFMFSGGALWAQNYLVASGTPTFVAPEPAELGFADVSNGNLHLEIAMGSYPQRAGKQPLNVELVYDSDATWEEVCGDLGCSWWSPYQTTPIWRLSTQVGSEIAGINCGSNGACPEYVYQDSLGTSHYFPVQDNPCPNVAAAYASDSSGFMIKPCQEEVYAPDGTLVWSGPLSSTPNLAYRDTNGNYVTLGASVDSDTLGRTLPSTPATSYQLPNSQGSGSTYTVTTASIPVKTDFGQSGVSEFSGDLTVVQSVTLPDGTSYTFKYNCDSTTGNAACGSPGGQSAYYGMLTSMTMPTGGTVTYGYTTFSDSYGNKSEWLNWKTSDGTWYYTPQVISTCSSTQVGCQQQVTVVEPTGNYLVYTFTLNNGAWPVQIQSYGGGGTLLSTVTNTYDTSNACPFSGCYGAAYIRLLTSQTTLPVPGGSISKQTQYTYDSPQTGNITKLAEWRYYPGSSPSYPSNPDRATYTTYLSTGTNDIDRPLSVAVANSNSATVSDTLYTYDSYSGCSGGLQSVTGMTNHDDTNFGSGYTTRGNPTQIEQWVSGSTYLTTTYCYDSTGNVTETIDSADNVTTYGYTDNFYNDTGNPPETYSAPNPTNAYLTSITEPIIGTAHLGYYYGSGKQAVSTDQNSATTYSHFADPFNRPTETVLPIGWSLQTYPSSTEYDVYNAVGDTSPSTSCSSCRHVQNFLDSWGREAQQTLTNAPGLPINVSETYEANNLLQNESHAYTSTSDPNYVFEDYSYDGLDRQIQTTHPDNSYSKMIYGALVGQAGGLTSQQGSTTTYGVGYPVLMVDEEGKQKQEWVDGFGRVIEVDEPSSGTAQSVGSVTISGTEDSYTYQKCLHELAGGDCTEYENITVYDSGTVSITVDSFTESVTYGEASTDSSIASALASAFNSAPSSPVTASANGSVVLLTSKASGSGTNYALSATSATSDRTYFSGPSFSTTPSGSTLTSDQGFGSFSAPQVTLYTYDADNDLTGVVQASETRSFSYDGLSRKTSETTPEAGSISYSYTGCSGDPSNVCSETDARGITTTYTYDALNRLKSKSYSNGQGSVTYSYDQGGSSAFAMGRLTEMSDPSGSESYTYDADGDVLQLQKVIGSTTYTLQYQYNSGGELTQITYPSGRIVQYAYDVIGRLCNVAPSTSNSCSANSSYASAYSYDSAGHETGITFGNGIVGTYSYFPTTEQLSSLAYAQSGTNVFSLNYWYQYNATSCPSGTPDDDGPIQCITDNMDSGRTVNYAYDGINRLIAATTNGSTNYPQWGLAESYDQWSNRLTQSVTAGSGPSSSLSFNSHNQPTGSGYVYDASGDMTYDPATLDTYAYDDESRMVSVTGGASATYTYDANGFRVQKSANGTTTVFIYSGSQDIAEYDNGAAPSSPSREFIYGNGDMLAEVSGGATTYYQKDHLSVRMITDANGNVAGQQGHYPFGEQWYSSNGSSEWMFTSYQHNPETGLEYAMARYYDPRTATFCSADPAEGNPDDPESWNRYAYARDNPINITDPSGKFWLWDVLKIAAFVASDIFTPGAGMPEILSLMEGADPTLAFDLSALEGYALTGKAVSNAIDQAKQQGSSQLPSQNTQPPAPPNLYIQCPPVFFTIKAPAPNQATTPGGAAGVPKEPGDVAYNPHDFGLTNSEAKELDRSNTPIFFQPDWSKAQIIGRNGGVVPAAPNRGMPQIPSGLPTQGTLTGTDTLGGVHGIGNPPNTLDTYGYPTAQQARRATRRVPTNTFIPIESNAKCPQAQ
jgi:RHS repeat-associated protein